MTPIEFDGLGLVAFGAFGLVPAFRVGSIPTRWPFKPITRADRPTLYWTYVWFSVACVVLGLIIAAIGVARHI